MANSVDPDQTAPIGAVCSGSTLFASKVYSSVMLSNYLQQTTSADDIFRCIFFLVLKGLMVDTRLEAKQIVLECLVVDENIETSCINRHYCKLLHDLGYNGTYFLNYFLSKPVQWTL